MTQSANGAFSARSVILSLLFTLLLCLTASHARAAGSDPKSAPDRFEPGIVPVVGGSTDTGFGGGLILSLVRFQPGYRPYRYRIEANAFLTVDRFAGETDFPYQDYAVKGIFPDLFGSGVRLTVRAAHAYSANLKYSGIGNASRYDRFWETIDRNEDPEGWREARRFYSFDRIRPSVMSELRFDLGRSFYLLSGASFTHSTTRVRPFSALNRDLAVGPPEVRSMLRGFEGHGDFLFLYALQYDTRDDEISPQRGSFHKLGLRLSPGGVEALPYRWAGGTAIGRWFIPVHPRLTFATRAVFDLIQGDPPFYELARFDTGQYALGGQEGVRGVPAQRYYGKVKAFGNLEARTRLFAFRLMTQPIEFGVVAFFDTGRLWTDLHGHPELDGTGVGLKYGAGGGLRFRQGHAFVVKLDVAWSPDAFPVSMYFGAGHAF